MRQQGRTNWGAKANTPPPHAGWGWDTHTHSHYNKTHSLKCVAACVPHLKVTRAARENGSCPHIHKRTHSPHIILLLSSLQCPPPAPSHHPPPSKAPPPPPAPARSIHTSSLRGTHSIIPPFPVVSHLPLPPASPSHPPTPPPHSLIHSLSTLRLHYMHDGWLGAGGGWGGASIDLSSAAADTQRKHGREKSCGKPCKHSRNNPQHKHSHSYAFMHN